MHDNWTSAVRRVFHVAETADATRMNIKAVRFEPTLGLDRQPETNGACVVATDGHRLAYARVRLPLPAAAATVPYEAVVRALAAKPSPGAPYANAEFVLKEAMEQYADSDGNRFVDWRHVIPLDQPASVSVERKALLDAARLFEKATKPGGALYAEWAADYARAKAEREQADAAYRTTKARAKAEREQADAAYRTTKAADCAQAKAERRRINAAHRTAKALAAAANRSAVNARDAAEKTASEVWSQRPNGYMHSVIRAQPDNQVLRWSLSEHADIAAQADGLYATDGRTSWPERGIGVNVAYLAEAVRSFGRKGSGSGLDRIRIAVLDALSPILVQAGDAAGPDAFGDDFELIMPHRL